MISSDALNFETSLQTLRFLIPELVVILTAIAVMTLGAFIRQPRRVWALSAVGALLVALIALYGVKTTTPDLYMAVAINDDFSWFFRMGLLLAGFVIVALAHDQVDDARAPEYFGSILLIQAGAMLVAAANDIVLLFAALELVSIPTYLILYLNRRGAATQEVATKYFFLSIFSSALLLFGLAYLYGITGSSNLKVIGYMVHRVAGMPQGSLALIALVFVAAGLAFRVAAVPFHFYAPDVYEGSSTLVAGLLSWIPKAIGFAAMIRALTAVFGSVDVIQDKALMLSWLIAAATMTVGNTVALRQTNLKRLLAYSSIAHAGYLMMGIAAAFFRGPITGSLTRLSDAPTGIEAILLYLVAYALMTLGAFGVIILLSTPERPVESIADLNGLAKSHKWVARAMLLCLLSLAGVPPLAGFFGKLWIFMSVLNATQADDPNHALFILLAVIGGINAAIGAFYYLRIVVAMYMLPAETPLAPPRRWPTAVATGACAGLSLLFLAYAGPLESACRQASYAAIYQPDPVQRIGIPETSAEETVLAR